MVETQISELRPDIDSLRVLLMNCHVHTKKAILSLVSEGRQQIFDEISDCPQSFK